MPTDPRLIWLVGACKKGGKPETRDMCEAGYVPVLFASIAEALDDVDARLPVEAVILLPSCSGNAATFTDVVRGVWPKANVCVACCQDDCSAPGKLACALAAANTNSTSQA